MNNLPLCQRHSSITTITIHTKWWKNDAFTELSLVSSSSFENIAFGLCSINGITEKRGSGEKQCKKSKTNTVTTYCCIYSLRIRTFSFKNLLLSVASYQTNPYVLHLFFFAYIRCVLFMIQMCIKNQRSHQRAKKTSLKKKSLKLSVFVTLKVLSSFNCVLICSTHTFFQALFLRMQCFFPCFIVVLLCKRQKASFFRFMHCFDVQVNSSTIIITIFGFVFFALFWFILSVRVFYVDFLPHTKQMLSVIHLVYF